MTRQRAQQLRSHLPFSYLSASLCVTFGSYMALIALLHNFFPPSWIRLSALSVALFSLPTIPLHPFLLTCLSLSPLFSSYLVPFLPLLPAIAALVHTFVPSSLHVFTLPVLFTALGFSFSVVLTFTLRCFSNPYVSLLDVVVSICAAVTTPLLTLLYKLSPMLPILFISVSHVFLVIFFIFPLRLNSSSPTHQQSVTSTSTSTSTPLIISTLADTSPPPSPVSPCLDLKRTWKPLFTGFCSVASLSFLRVILPYFAITLLTTSLFLSLLSIISAFSPFLAVSAISKLPIHSTILITFSSTCLAFHLLANRIRILGIILSTATTTITATLTLSDITHAMHEHNMHVKHPFAITVAFMFAVADVLGAFIMPILLTSPPTQHAVCTAFLKMRNLLAVVTFIVFLSLIGSSFTFCISFVFNYVQTLFTSSRRRQDLTF